MAFRDDLWTGGNWREYESYVFGALQRRFRQFPNARVAPNARLKGLKSGRDRQIDVLVELSIGGCDIKIAFDCKCYRRKVNIKDVEGFIGMIDDVRISQGVLITTKGFTKAAYERVERETRDVDVQILHPERLSHFQFVGCLWIWRGAVAAIVKPPLGWVVDVEGTEGPFQFSMYPLGHDRASAMKACPFLYGSIVLKTEASPTMLAIAAGDERRVVQQYPAAKFKHLCSAPAGSGDPDRTLLREGLVNSSYGGPEYSLYVDAPQGVLRLVLLCPAGQDHVYLPALEWIGRGAVMMSRQDEGNAPLAAAELEVVGCTLFPRGLRKRLLESEDRELLVTD